MCGDLALRFKVLLWLLRLCITIPSLYICITVNFFKKLGLSYIIQILQRSTSLSKLHYAQHFSHSFHQITHTAAQKSDIKGLHHAVVMSSTKHQVFINPLNTFHHALLLPSTFMLEFLDCHKDDKEGCYCCL